MFDYFKSHTSNRDLANRLREHPLLEFKFNVDDKTGEMDNVMIAEFKGLKFSLCMSGGVLMEGSLHKFNNDGFHNANDFGMVQLEQVLNKIHKLFGIDPAKMRVRMLEFGVNIIPHVPTNDVLNRLIVYGGKEFNNMVVIGKGFGKQVYLDQYGVKIYNKSLQYGIMGEILRFEFKTRKMEFLRKGKVFLSDFLKENFRMLCRIRLLEFFDRITFDEDFNDIDLSSKEIKLLMEVRNPRNWKKFERRYRSRLKKTYEDLVTRISHSRIKRSIRQALTEKMAILNGWHFATN